MSRPFRSTALASKETGSRGEGGEAAAAEPPPEGTLDAALLVLPRQCGLPPARQALPAGLACLSTRTPKISFCLEAGCDILA